MKIWARTLTPPILLLPEWQNWRRRTHFGYLIGTRRHNSRFESFGLSRHVNKRIKNFSCLTDLPQAHQAIPNSLLKLLQGDRRRALWCTVRWQARGALFNQNNSSYWKWQYCHHRRSPGDLQSECPRGSFCKEWHVVVSYAQWVWSDERQYFDWK